MTLCANTDCRINRSHLGLPCVNEQKTGRKCFEGAFYTLLDTTLADFAPWGVRRYQGEPYAVMDQRGSGGERVEVWPHKSGPYEVIVVTGRSGEMVWRSESWADGLDDVVARACEAAGIRIQQTLDVDG